MAARILIIDDDELSRDLLRYLLQAAGYSVLEAPDGGAGYQLALQGVSDLILCDLQMPVLNGYEVVRRLRADPHWRRVPVIALTAFSQSSERGSALAGGFDEHLSKPIAPEKFIQQIEAFLPQDLRGISLPRN